MVEAGTRSDSCSSGGPATEPLPAAVGASVRLLRDEREVADDFGDFLGAVAEMPTDL